MKSKQQHFNQSDAQNDYDNKASRDRNKEETTCNNTTHSLSDEDLKQQVESSKYF